MVLSLTSFQDVTSAVIHCCRWSIESFSCCYDKIVDRNSLREERFCSAPAFLVMDFRSSFHPAGPRSREGNTGT